MAKRTQLEATIQLAKQLAYHQDLSSGESKKKEKAAAVILVEAGSEGKTQRQEQKGQAEDARSSGFYIIYLSYIYNINIE